MNQRIKKIRQILVAFTILAAITVLTSCEKYTYTPPAVDPNFPWSFNDDIQPIFTSNCILCHGGLQSPNLSAGKAYASLTNGSYVNLPAEDSRLYKQITSSGHTARTSDTEKLKILYWIAQGAHNN